MQVKQEPPAFVQNHTNNYFQQYEQVFLHYQQFQQYYHQLYQLQCEQQLQSIQRQQQLSQQQAQIQLQPQQILQQQSQLLVQSQLQLQREPQIHYQQPSQDHFKEFFKNQVKKEIHKHLQRQIHLYIQQQVQQRLQQHFQKLAQQQTQKLYQQLPQQQAQSLSQQLSIQLLQQLPQLLVLKQSLKLPQQQFQKLTKQQLQKFAEKDPQQLAQQEIQQSAQQKSRPLPQQLPQLQSRQLVQHELLQLQNQSQQYYHYNGNLYTPEGNINLASNSLLLADIQLQRYYQQVLQDTMKRRRLTSQEENMIRAELEQQQRYLRSFQPQQLITSQEQPTHTIRPLQLLRENNAVQMEPQKIGQLFKLPLAIEQTSNLSCIQQLLTPVLQARKVINIDLISAPQSTNLTTHRNSTSTKSLVQAKRFKYEAASENEIQTINKNNQTPQLISNGSNIQASKENIKLNKYFAVTAVAAVATAAASASSPPHTREEQSKAINSNMQISKKSFDQDFKTERVSMLGAPPTPSPIIASLNASLEVSTKAILSKKNVMKVKSELVEVEKKCNTNKETSASTVVKKSIDKDFKSEKGDMKIDEDPNIYDTVTASASCTGNDDELIIEAEIDIIIPLGTKFEKPLFSVEKLPPIDDKLKKKCEGINRSQKDYGKLFSRVNLIMQELNCRYSNNDANTELRATPPQSLFGAFTANSVKSGIDSKPKNVLPISVISEMERFFVTRKKEMDMKYFEYPKTELCNNENIVIIGPNGTRITEFKFAQIIWTSAAIATRTLLLLVFTTDELATHSLTGRPSPAFYGRERPLKMQLDINRVDDIIVCVINKTGGKERHIRATITTKCAEIAKKLKREKARDSNITTK